MAPPRVEFSDRAGENNYGGRRREGLSAARRDLWRLSRAHLPVGVMLVASLTLSPWRKRQLAVPVSMMSALWVIRSSTAANRRRSGNTLVHSPNGRPVVSHPPPVTWPWKAPHRRPSKCPTGGHCFSPWVALFSPPGSVAKSLQAASSLGSSLTSCSSAWSCRTSRRVIWSGVWRVK